MKICTWLIIAALFVIGKHWEQPKFLPKRWLVKETVAHPYQEYLPAVKKWTIYWYSNNLDGAQVHDAECKKPISKSHILYDSIYITLSQWQIVQLESILVVARGWGGVGEELGMTQKGQRKDICGDGISIWTAVVGTWIFTCDKMTQKSTYTLYQHQFSSFIIVL